MQTAKSVEQPNAAIQQYANTRGLTAGKIIIYLLLTGLAVLCIIPFYLMLIYSTHNNATIASTFTFLPGSFLIDNYMNMVSKINIWRGFANSIFIAGTSTVLSLYIGALTAYGFAKFKFKGRNGLFLFLLATMMVPGQLALIGVYRLFSMMGLLDSYAAIILPAAANAFNVFLSNSSWRAVSRMKLLNLRGWTVPVSSGRSIRLYCLSWGRQSPPLAYSRLSDHGIIS